MIKSTTSRLSKFIRSEQSSGILLVTCVIISLLIANSSAGKNFEQLLAYKVGPKGNLIDLKLSVLNWINDGLMAIFFFYIGLEIKQEVTEGHLSGLKKAAVPVFAAIGGAVMPALIYALFNNGTPTAAGWGIPMATDIAFALGALSMLGKLVPSSIKAFLSALAVVDDLLAILVIAMFYSEELNWTYLFGGLAIFVILMVMNKLGVKKLVYYIIPGIVMWYLIHHSGIHATIAGVLTAFTIPLRSANGSPLKRLAHQLALPVTLGIMPVFAVANTNIVFEGEMLKGITSILGLGIILGLLIGKPLGILTFSWLSVKTRIGSLPHGVTWKQLLGVGALAGIGFTMSIFVAFLSFGNSPHNNEAKLAILVASCLAGTIGFIYLRSQLRPPQLK